MEDAFQIASLVVGSDQSKRLNECFFQCCMCRIIQRFRRIQNWKPLLASRQVPPMPNPKVPDAVLEAAMASADLPEQARERMRIALEAALAQHHKELLGDEAAEAAARLFLGHERHLRTDMDEFRAQLQAAIDSVMKGGNGG